MRYVATQFLIVEQPLQSKTHTQTVTSTNTPKADIQRNQIKITISIYKYLSDYNLDVFVFVFFFVLLHSFRSVSKFVLHSSICLNRAVLEQNNRKHNLYTEKVKKLKKWENYERLKCRNKKSRTTEREAYRRCCTRDYWMHSEWISSWHCCGIKQ